MYGDVIYDLTMEYGEGYLLTGSVRDQGDIWFVTVE